MSRILIKAKTIADHRGVLASPGVILCEGNSILAVGEPAAIGHLDDVQITQIDGTVMPSFVNVHTHLDLSSVGPVDYDGEFTHWLKHTVTPIRREASPSDIVDAVTKGAAMSLKGGCSIVGDISGSLESANAFLQTPLLGRAFIECFGVGTKENTAVERIQSIPEEFGISPHAPYSCGPNVYQAAFLHGSLVSTHIAETKEEIEFTKKGVGSFEVLLREMGAWDKEFVVWGVHPVEGLLHVAKQRACIAAHCNYLEDTHIESLAKSNVSVAYCPRASRYFGHSNHRWKDMVDAGVNVAIGTDSLICLDTPDHISVLDDMRLLYAQDNGDPKILFTMATVNGANALQLEESLVRLEQGMSAGLLAFEGIEEDPLKEILESSLMPTWVGMQPSYDF